MKVKAGGKQQCRLHSNGEKTSECHKLAQMEYKTRHNWLGKVIHWELNKIKIKPYKQMLYGPTKMFTRE